MAETIDSLQIEINAKAQTANNAIDALVDKLDILSNSLGKLDGAKITNFAESVNWLASSLRNVAGIDGRTFTALQKNITKLADINPATLSYSATSISDMATSLDKIASSANSLEGVKAFASAISKLGNKNVATATANIPQLATALNQLMVTLSKAPTVNKSIIDMTNALANLASQGSKVGSASSSVVNGLNRTNAAAKRASSSTMSLARAFGKFYANYFLLVRGFKGMFNMMKSAMELTETVNYFEVTLNNIGQNAKDSWKEYGYESADAYADSFAERLRESNEKLTGFAVSETGQISQSVFSGLGISPATATQYSAMFAQVANSIGMTEEASIALSEAFVRLGADWASLRNVDFEVAYEKLASGLSGQSRALRAFGLDITMASLQSIAFANGIEKSVSEMTQSEKAYLRLIAIIEQSEVAFGDLANTLSSPANQMRYLSQGVQNLGTLIGNLFLPLLQRVLPVLNGFVIAMQRIVIAISETMGIDTSGFNTSLGGMDEGFGDLSDSVDEATESAEKFNRATRGWDELNVLGKDTSKGYGVGNNLVENEELLAAYDKAIEKYRKAWEKAYKNINNEAEDFAEKILGGTDVLQKIKDLTKAIKDFKEEMKPFGEGFGKGFTQVFETLGGVSYKIITEGLENISKVVGYFDDNSVEKAGEVMGGIVGTLVVAAGIKTTFTPLVTGIGKLAVALKNPIFGAFALTSGILTLINMANDTNYDASGVQAFSDKVDNLRESLINLGEEDTEGFTAASSLETVYEEWKKIAFKVEELTNEEKGLLKLYGDQIKQYCEGANDFIDENGAAFAGVGKELDDLIKKTVLYYKVQGAKTYMESLYVQEAEFEIETENAKKKIDELVERLKELNPKLSESDIKKYADGLARGVLQADAIVSGREKQFGIERNFLNVRTKEGQKIYEEIVNSMKDLASYYAEYDEALLLLEDLRGKISSAAESYIEKQNEYNTLVGEGTKKTQELTTATENNTDAAVLSADKFKILGQSLSNVSEASKKAAINVSQLKKIMKDIPSLDFSILNPMGIGKISLPKYANGGFPEDGLFMANHNELVGKFSNGKTAVANNAQITQGIEEAAYRGMTRALATADFGAHATFDVKGDPNGLFTVVQQKATQYTKSTGRNAFGY